MGMVSAREGQEMGGTRVMPCSSKVRAMKSTSTASSVRAAFVFRFFWMKAGLRLPVRFTRSISKLLPDSFSAGAPLNADWKRRKVSVLLTCR